MLGHWLQALEEAPGEKGGRDLCPASLEVNSMIKILRKQVSSK